MKELINNLIQAAKRRHERVLKIRKLKGQIYTCLESLNESITQRDPKKMADALDDLHWIAISTSPYEVLDLQSPVTRRPRPFIFGRHP